MAASGMTGAASLLERCRGRGVRLTKPRKAIADVVAAAADHPDAMEIHRRAGKLDPKISLSTVYRTLKLFADIGLIDRHSFQEGRARIEAVAAHHDHLIDVETGAVVEFRCEEIERLQAEMARKLGYELTGHRMELYGHKLRAR